MLVLLRNRKIPFPDNRLVPRYWDQKESSRRRSDLPEWAPRTLPSSLGLQSQQFTEKQNWKQLTLEGPGLGWRTPGLGVLEEHGPERQRLGWKCLPHCLLTVGILSLALGENGFEDVPGLFSSAILGLTSTFSHHLRKCLQDHYDGRSSYKSVD